MEKPLSIKLHKLLLSEFPNSSQNLAKFARSGKYLRLKKHYRIYRDANDDLHIGFCDDIFLNGRNLLSIACGDFQTFAYSNCQMQDVTEWFMREYKEKGMCAYTDMRHEWDMNEPDEDIGAGSTRVCIYCGKKEMMKATVVRKTWWEESKL
ncbi:hypothetical protein [Vibrio litoralis]|uniref:hypothetical protein n=1 Tax=Vibrio litoralis TaxID=335972 RepID=UPI0004826EE5|nr:hypothetical protein [Vibrio litoralis]